MMSHFFRFRLLLHAELQVLLDGLAFMTRLCPARSVTPDTLAATMPRMPLFGLVVGAVCVVPLWLGAAQGHALVQSWLYVAASAWLTRGLHWDGWADLWDAWGSQAQGERFWNIIKDSRMGAFGAMGIVLGMGGCMAAATELLRTAPHAHALDTLLWAPVLGRSACVILARCGTKASCSTLGRQFIEGATPQALIISTALCIGLGLGLVGVRTLIISMGILAPALVLLARLARRQQGLNGDFLGAVIIWGELSALLGAVMA